MTTHNTTINRNDPDVRFVNKSLHFGSLLGDLMSLRGWDEASVIERLGITGACMESYTSGTHDFTLREIASIESLFNEDFIKVLH